MADESLEAAERRRRLRWLTLAEILGVAALVISALTLWNNYSERRSAEDDRTAENRKASAKARKLILRATVEKDGDRLGLSAGETQLIQSQTILFPKALDLDSVESSDPRIEANWFAGNLKKAIRAAGDDDRPRGDARLPIAITTRFTVDGEVAEDIALYDVGYATDSSFLGGTTVRLRGLSLIGHADATMAQARVDALWRSRHKAAK